MKRLIYLIPFVLAALLRTPVSAQVTFQSGDLIKSDSNPAVYYFAANGKRYVFPTERTYFTWYADFSTVKTITTGELASIPLGGNVNYRPGVKMLKITSDPKVYAVSKSGILRAIGSEAVASALYGSTWNKQIDDLADAFFVNYRVGEPIAAASGFDKDRLRTGSPTINIDKLMTPPPTGFVDLGANSTALSPTTMTVSPGTKVTWTALDESRPFIASNPHPIHSDEPSLQSGTLRLGESYTYTFSNPGTYGYHNHNSPGITGQVIVQ